MNQKIVLALIILMTISSLSIVSVKSAFSQVVTPGQGGVPPPSIPIPTPSIPSFTVQAINSSSFMVVIQNQPFKPFNDSGTIVNLYYDVQVSNTTSGPWQEIYDAYDGYPEQSNSQTTILVISGWVESGCGHPLPVGRVFQVEVEALEGYPGREVPLGDYPPPWVLWGEQSGWSSPQTVTLPASNTTAIPTPTTVTPQNPTTGIQTKTGLGVNWMEITLLIAVAIIAVLVVAFVVMTVRHRKSAAS